MTKITPEKVAEVNQNLPLHSMWDGFWVHSFKNGRLEVSCSFDRIYYRDFDIIFREVIFFNLPDEWRDTDIYGEELLRLSNHDEFSRHHPDFDTQQHSIIAIDIHFTPWQKSPVKHTFFVVTTSVELQKCIQYNNSPAAEYKEKFPDEPFPCKKNRVGA
jgi:hypothetical protein